MKVLLFSIFTLLRVFGGRQEPEPAQGPDWTDLKQRLVAGDRYVVHEFVLAGASSVPHLEAVMNDPQAGNAQFMAANILGDLGLPECVDPLLRGLEHDWFNVRRCAALALARAGSPRARSRCSTPPRRSSSTMPR